MNAGEEIDGDNRIRKILVRAPNWVGDNIFAVPAVQRLKRDFPAARLVVLAAEGLAPLWELVEGVDGVIPFQLRGGFKDLAGKRRLISRLRAAGFDLAVIFPRSFESALWIRLAGIPRRWGYAEEGRSLLLTRPVRSETGYRRTPRVDYYYRLPAGAGAEAPPARLVISPALKTRALDLLREAGVDPGEKPLAGFHTRASYGPAKCWPMENFARLARLLTERKGAKILLLGSAEERDLLDKFAAGEGAVNLAGRTDLKTLAAVISLCRVVIANDSGPLHLSAALGAGTIGLYGSTDPSATGPRGEKVRVIYRGAECSPCLLRVCPRDFSCMKKITPEEVMAAVEELWPSSRRPDGE